MRSGGIETYYERTEYFAPSFSRQSKEFNTDRHYLCENSPPLYIEDQSGRALEKMTLDLQSISDRVDKHSRSQKELRRLEKDHLSIIQERDELFIEFKKLERDVRDAAEILELKEYDIQDLTREYESKKKHLDKIEKINRDLAEEIEREKCDKERISHDSERKLTDILHQIHLLKEKIDRRFQRAEVLQSEYDIVYHELQKEKERNIELKQKNVDLEEETAELRNMYLVNLKKDEYSRQESAFTRYELDSTLKLLEQTSADFDKSVGKLKDLEARCDELLKENYRLQESYSAYEESINRDVYL